VLAPEVSPLGYFEEIGANPTTAETQIQNGYSLRSQYIRAGQKQGDHKPSFELIRHKTLLGSGWLE
jgi:hypothetical protein